MNRTLIYTIEKDNNSEKIEHFLRQRGYSRQLLTNLKQDSGSVQVNGQPRYMNERLSEGDQLVIHICETEVSEKIEPVALPLDILYEDEDLLVVNKPSGMPVHPSIHNYDNTLANALAYYFKQQEKPFVFRCTNRLDRDTSGITIISKHLLSSGILSSMVMKHEVNREYLALVRGYDLPDQGTIHAPLGRKPGSIIERMVDFQNGEDAITHYKVVKKENGHSLVSLKLETGRTHQIRIHMKYLGHPLIGDYLYNPDMEHIHRQALHSYKMSFYHPITGQFMEFCVPMPDDMNRIIPFPPNSISHS
ncbi:RluA family pseudouridine synthase [Frisingicoccus sp.]|uniref:RluA family pseudouridine synthase n=1 Tax=Frisingicoccus sp. TaxID=1918627 RepID=UPI002EC5940C|nr:RluA family pseudouridine synthase [Frisingicoccus sp.]